jgi:hypothetical protein
MTSLDLRRPEAALRIGFGLVPIIAGADKFTRLLTDWDQYLSPPVRRRLPMRRRTFMKLVGLVEIGVGALVLTRWPRLGGYLASAWLAGIALELISGRDHYDVAARDALLAVGAFTLARLSEARPILPAWSEATTGLSDAALELN